MWAMPMNVSRTLCEWTEQVKTQDNAIEKVLLSVSPSFQFDAVLP